MYSSAHQACPAVVPSHPVAAALLLHHTVPRRRMYLETLPRLLHFSFGQLSQLVYALAVLQVAPPHQWLRAVLRAGHAKLGAATAAEVSNTLWGLRRLSFKPNT